MYKWKLCYNKTTIEGSDENFHAMIDRMIHHANGNQVRDFYINGHHMNQEFDLWIDNGKVVHDDGSEFVPMNKWYDILRIPGEHYEAEEDAA